MSDWREVTADQKHIKKEREKARELKKSAWWHAKIQAGICHYCSGKFAPDELTMDHIVPLARGGTSAKGNIAVSCKACNASKKLDTPVEKLFEQLEKERVKSGSGNDE